MAHYVRVYYAHRDVGLLYSEGRVGGAGRGWVVLRCGVLGLRLDVHAGVDGRGTGRGVAVRVVDHVLSVWHDVRVDQQRLEVLDVRAGQLERVDLGEFPRGRVGGHQLAELVEGGVDRVHPLALALVGCRPLPQVLFGLDILRIRLAVLVAALVGAGAARTPAARAPVVRRVTVLAQRGLVSSLTVGIRRLRLLLRGAGLGVIIVDVSVVRCSGRSEAAVLSLHSGGREAGGRIAQGLHRRAHGCFALLERLGGGKEVCLLP